MAGEKHKCCERASIKLRTNGQQSQALSDLRAAYAEACNRLVPDVVANRCWNRVVLHHKAYYGLRRETPLGSQMVRTCPFR